MDVPITIELSDEQLLKLSLIAHEQNITLNQLCVNILEEYVANNSTDSVEVTDIDVQVKNMRLEKAVIKAACDLALEVSVTTVARYGHAYEEWFNDYDGSSNLEDLINAGFIEAEHIQNTH